MREQHRGAHRDLPFAEHRLDPPFIPGGSQGIDRGPHGQPAGQDAVGPAAGPPDGRDSVLRPEALFPVYSVTKTLVAAAVMLLVERGIYILFNPIHTYDAGWPDAMGDSFPEPGVDP